MKDTRKSQILELRKLGYSVREIAQKIEVPKTNVGRIIKEFDNPFQAQEQKNDNRTNIFGSNLSELNLGQYQITDVFISDKSSEKVNSFKMNIYNFKKRHLENMKEYLKDKHNETVYEIAEKSKRNDWTLSEIENFIFEIKNQIEEVKGFIVENSINERLIITQKKQNMVLFLDMWAKLIKTNVLAYFRFDSVAYSSFENNYLETFDDLN